LLPRAQNGETRAFSNAYSRFYGRCRAPERPAKTAGC
jgi:hypothetical protein